MELQEIVRILKNDEEFQKKGIYCPKGVLLNGPPGTGKTLLAKAAIAGEAGLPFFAANGTDFVEQKGTFEAKKQLQGFLKLKPVRPADADEYGALIYAGRWGIHGV